ncbi:hypothetical protein CHS0354_009998 [Potamilus streckersoni]|uniref:Transmembrane protein 135 N-terminal domain-containing protein n=1 Tax=Potamilus streckersoni TaxID=2493646 RepID=A0AAE0SCU8_9BIVA|nr:hypothetical protein CHS0354_009998 [Potamilus streckersoni]
MSTQHYKHNKEYENAHGFKEDFKLSESAKTFLRRFLKGFGSGVGLFAGFKLVSALMRNPFREKFPNIPQVIMSKDCARFAAFLGLYPSLYELTLDLVQRFRGRKDDWNSGIAGGLAGLSIVVEEPTRRRVVCLFAIARAIGALLSTLVKRDKIPIIPHTDTLFFCACCSLLVYCNALKPQYLFEGYYRSVLKWSRDYTDKKLHSLFRATNDHFVTCNEVGLHKDTCTMHAIKDVLWSFPAFAKLYIPIHVTPVLVFRQKLVWQKPMKVLKSLIQNIVMSTTFLASMVMLAKYVICLLRNVQHRPPPLPGYIPAIAGFTAGLGVLFERASRRKELALFLVPHSLYALYLWAKEAGLVRHIPYSSVVLYALSMASVMHAYEREPESLSVLLHGILRYFVGKRESTVERRRREISETSM